ncbi:hypothetical protein FANTH_6515 [Fusarium anthophilum]|uniref:Uncharacterized protein n=1 Tax=Fusarium anthophilum TaxID=48485 RepID=A0A8H4ZI76_9HYPO|nr:hypothetical protein FANTH_6515 [Fusarium anthophilum]
MNIEKLGTDLRETLSLTRNRQAIRRSLELQSPPLTLLDSNIRDYRTDGLDCLIVLVRHIYSQVLDAYYSGEENKTAEEKGPKGAKLPMDPTVKGWPTVVAYCEGLKRDDQEKALAEARAKVTEAQKALAAMMSHTEEPESSWSAAKEGSEDTDMAGNTPVEPAPEDHRGVTSVPEAEEASAKAALFALEKEEKEKANRQSWSEEVEDEDEGVDSDDDLEDDDLVRKRHKEKKAGLARRAIRAKIQATEE